jgi:hypothetical protein
VNEPESAAPAPLTPAVVQAAVALVSLAALDDPALTAAELLGDTDPSAVALVLSIALSSALRAMLGVEGRTSVLEYLALDAARRLP